MTGRVWEVEVPSITEEDREAIAEDVRHERTADAATPCDEGEA